MHGCTSFCVCLFVSMYVCTHMSVCVCVSLCMCMCMCVYVCVCMQSTLQFRYCVSSEKKLRLEHKYASWSDDEFAVRISRTDVGAFPPYGGTPECHRAKRDSESIDDWYEYNTDFLPEELVHDLNSGRGGFVSQRRLVKLPCAAPRDNSECIKRMCDLLTTSCPQTQLLLQKEIDRIVVGSEIK